ncbi:MAG: 4-alpha-glucanotransferase, partial [Thermoanaerobaculum sp.]|nr:4-alpha-glucanotransferase [Thermoanaerobaculum sp.]
MELPRSYGVLLPIHALPGPQPVGSLGEEAALFGRLLRERGAGFWQVLPLNPLGPGWSPYASPSSFAANPLLINLASLAEEGLLEPEELPPDTAGGEEAKYEQSLALWQQLRGKV